MLVPVRSRWWGLLVYRRPWAAPPTVVGWPLRRHGRGGDFSTPAPRTTTGLTTAPNNAADNGEEDEAADAGGNADDEGFVVVDPGADLGEGVGSLAYALSSFVSM